MNDIGITKAGITGHTRGIGLGIAEEFTARNIEVVGWSRSNGHDIRAPGANDKMVLDCITQGLDGLVLNAQASFQQVYQLYAIAEIWSSDPSKTVVVISSVAGDDTRWSRYPYSIQKHALDAAVDQLQANTQWRLINIRPGNTDTEFAKSIPDDIWNKMSVDQVVKTVFWTLEQPADVLIKNITFQPRWSKK